MASSSPVILYWHRHDLRLSDNPALHYAVQHGRVQPIFIYDETDRDWGYGGASRWWLHHSLKSLQESYKKLGVTLVLRQGKADAVLPKLAKEMGAAEIVWNRRYTPQAIQQDSDLKADLINRGFAVHSFNSHLLVEPWAIQTKAKTPFKVFTPFWRAMIASTPQIDAETPRPRKIQSVTTKIKSDDLTDWHLLPTKPNWAKSFEPVWSIGEQAAQKNLADFLDGAVGHYKNERDFPAIDGTSRLSPHLAFGEISPRQIWYTTQEAQARHKAGTAFHTHSDAFLRQIVWREFAYHLLYHFPETPTEPLYPQFKKMKWRTSKTEWRAWTTGQTGYPIVDAAMRQVWQTGWMHNRMRLVAASFLIKDLGLSWQSGSEWFWDVLVDADLANNTMGWQWVAGCGADASPYYRIFNPVTQSQKFDAKGDYIRTYVPEIAALPDKYIHAPWTAPDTVLKAAGITLGKHYPKPIVDHAFARERALDMLKATKAA
jgi:deoxyribodipyrimidine photo-lyase